MLEYFNNSPKVILNCAAFISYWLCVSRKKKRTKSVGEYETPEFDKAEKHMGEKICACKHERQQIHVFFYLSPVQLAYPDISLSMSAS